MIRKRYQSLDKKQASEERAGMRPIGKKRNDFMKSGPVNGSI